MYDSVSVSHTSTYIFHGPYTNASFVGVANATFMTIYELKEIVWIAGGEGSQGFVTPAFCMSQSERGEGSGEGDESKEAHSF